MNRARRGPRSPDRRHFVCDSGSLDGKGGTVSQRWYLLHSDGTSEGPISTAEILQGITSGTIRHDTEACKTGEDQWELVDDGVAPYEDYLVGEADGPIRFTMRHVVKKDHGCILAANELRDGRFMYQALGDGETKNFYDSLADGLIYGDVGQPSPSLGPRNDTDENSSWNGNAHWFVKGTYPTLLREIYTPDLIYQQPLWISGDDPDGLPFSGAPVTQGTDIFFNVGTLSMIGIMAFDAEKGVRPLVRYYGDTTQGASNIGTDGKHLVWTHGTGKAAGEQLYPTRSIMAADYTTDAASLSPVRLRSDPSADIGNEFVVGCGYASHAAAASGDILIVRISDGVSWTLQQVPGWRWSHPLGITCEEVFAIALIDNPLTSNTEQDPTIARVRIDLLGPGTPAD